MQVYSEVNCTVFSGAYSLLNMYRIAALLLVGDFMYQSGRNRQSSKMPACIAYNNSSTVGILHVGGRIEEWAGLSPFSELHHSEASIQTTSALKKKI